MVKKTSSIVISLCIIAALIMCISKCNQPKNDASYFTMRVHYLLNDAYEAQPALTSLARTLEVPLGDSLDTIVKATQEAWLRKPGSERWHIEKKYDEERMTLAPYFYQLGMLQDVNPAQQHYDYALFLGATVVGVRARLAYLTQLWQQGTRFDSIVFLGGHRPLDPQIEGPEVLLSNTEPTLPFKKEWQLAGALPTVETEMMRMVVDQTDLAEEMKKVPVVYIDVPMKTTLEGKLARPTTGDTIEAWLATNPKPGSCLAVSCQPHVNYQDTVIRTYLPKEFALETVGKATNPEKENPGVILDALARCLYQAKVYRDMVNK